jgi:hypothetical protein
MVTDPFGRKVYARQQSDIDDALLTRVADDHGRALLPRRRSSTP